MTATVDVSDNHATEQDGEQARIERQLATITDEVRDHILGMPLTDLYNAINHWIVTAGLDELPELQPVSLAVADEEFYEALTKAGLPTVGGAGGAGRIFAHESFKFGVLLGMAAAMRVAYHRTFDDSFDYHDQEPLMAVDAVRAYLDAGHVLDRYGGTPSGERAARVERRRLYGGEQTQEVTS